MSQLITLNEIPDGLLDLEADELTTMLSGTTLVHLSGRRREPLFITVLLHGNEITGWQALRGMLRKFQHKELPRSLSFLVGNVSAAAEGARHLPGQPDYNRIWDGRGGSEQQMMSEVVEQMRQRNVFASIDVHNNTGRNPHYGCVNLLEQSHLHLATLFSRTVVYFTRPAEVQSIAMSKICPAVTVECGQPGEPHGVEHAQQFLESCLHLSKIPSHPVAHGDVDLFHTVATVKIPGAVRFGFGDSDQGMDSLDLCFADDLDQLNFQEIPAGTSFGVVCSDRVDHIEVWSEAGEDVGDRFFEVEDGELRTKRAVMPSMLTRDEEVIRQDCLCYLMERMDYSD